MRRRFILQPLGRAFTSLAILSMLLAGATATGTGLASASSANGKVGGTLELAVPTAPDCLDPQATAAASSNYVDSFVVDPLISLDNKGSYVPLLASFKGSDHGLLLTFHLKHNIKFSNGDPLTASDVRYTFNRAVSPAEKSGVSGGMLADVSSTVVLNKYTVELKLKAPDRPLLGNLAGAYLGILDSKAPPTCSSVIGTGPYKIVSTGASLGDVKFVVNKHHTFGPNWVHNPGVPYITNLEIQTIPDVDTEISDFVSNSLSIVAVPGTELSRVKSDSNAVIHKLPGQNLDWISFNNAHSPFNNVAVRRAVAATIDRKGMIRAALHGQGVAVYGPLPPSLAFYDKAAGKYLPTFNIKAAHAVFKAHHMLGHTYQLLACSCTPFGTMSVILQSDLDKAGLNINIETVGDIGSFLGKATSGQFDIDMLNYQYPDPSVLNYLVQKGGPLNWLHWSNPKLDTLLTDGDTVLKASKDAQIYAQAQVLLNKQAIFVGMDSETSLLATQKNLKGFHTNTTGSYAVQDLYFG